MTPHFVHVFATLGHRSVRCCCLMYLFSCGVLYLGKGMPTGPGEAWEYGCMPHMPKSAVWAHALTNCKWLPVHMVTTVYLLMLKA